jgi:hypothetical protein
MINRKTIICVLALFGLFSAATASAQPRWGRERQPQAGACFYEHINFGGRYFCVHPGERLRSLPSHMGDEISSVRIVGSADVTVFRDKDMRGRSARFTNDVADLRRGGWNDQISSLEIGRGSGGGDWGGGRPPVWGRGGQIPREGACFYEDADFRGQYFCLARGATYSSMPRGFNDRISSIRVFRGGVRIFQDRDFRGRSTEIRSDVRDLRGSWRDTISSLRVF